MLSPTVPLMLKKANIPVVIRCLTTAQCLDFLFGGGGGGGGGVSSLLSHDSPPRTLDALTKHQF